MNLVVGHLETVNMRLPPTINTKECYESMSVPEVDCLTHDDANKDHQLTKQQENEDIGAAKPDTMKCVESQVPLATVDDIKDQKSESILKTTTATVSQPPSVSSSSNNDVMEDEVVDNKPVEHQDIEAQIGSATATENLTENSLSSGDESSTDQSCINDVTKQQAITANVMESDIPKCVESQIPSVEQQDDLKDETFGILLETSTTTVSQPSIASTVIADNVHPATTMDVDPKTSELDDPRIIDVPADSNEVDNSLEVVDANDQPSDNGDDHDDADDHDNYDNNADDNSADDHDDEETDAETDSAVVVDIDNQDNQELTDDTPDDMIEMDIIRAVAKKAAEEALQKAILRITG